MNKNIKLSLLAITMILLSSCDDSKTKVINTIHKDGSITRTVIVKKSKIDFDYENIRVPIDSTWNTDIFIEINEKEDTSWIFTAEKHFANVEELNVEYDNDQGSNSIMQRSASFSKKFKWFTSNLRFSETIEKTLNVSCPMSDYFSDEELKFIYSPDLVQKNLENGVDSLKIMELKDSIDVKSEIWIFTGLFRQWIDIFYDLVENHTDLTISREEMRLLESRSIPLLIEDNIDEDQFFISLMGEEFFNTFRTEIDSSISALDKMGEAFWSAKKYDMEIRMPGKIIASNGYFETIPDSLETAGILWTINGEFFLTQQYEMWAESQINNYWTWIISALFALAIITFFGVRFNK
ncbi:MAG: hypothetical protein KAS71_12740 [Bacteroidales bacterium]|nr:hypothetical protein [Bacteroidales bacterium]